MYKVHLNIKFSLKPSKRTPVNFVKAKKTVIKTPGDSADISYFSATSQPAMQAQIRSAHLSTSTTLTATAMSNHHV